MTIPHVDNDKHVAQQPEPPQLAEPAPSVSSPDTNGVEKGEPNGISAKQSQLEPLSRTARLLILGPVTLAYFLWFLDLAVVSTATPAITSEFHSLVDVGW